MEVVSLAVVVLAALYLVGLAAASFFAPDYAARFLNGFAGSARAHYSEMLIRLIAGGALVLAAPQMIYTSIYLLFGWVLVLSSLVLLFLPWRWHQKFASKVVPPLSRRVRLFGLISLLLGGVILFSVLSGVNG